MLALENPVFGIYRRLVRMKEIFPMSAQVFFWTLTRVCR
jgi:hypothetical protein